MKKNILSVIVSIFIAGAVYSQNDSVPVRSPLYSTFEFCSSNLTANNVVSSKSPDNFISLSGSWYFYWNVPLSGLKHDSQPYGFSLAPGLGFGFNVLSLDKRLADTNNTVEFVPITRDYDRSLFQLIFIDAPLDFRYMTKPNDKRQNFGFELGGKIGYLVFSQSAITYPEGNKTITISESNIDDFNKVRYGVSAKISYRKLRVNKSNQLAGASYSLLTNYYLSDIFKDDNGIGKYYSIGLGLSLIFE